MRAAVQSVMTSILKGIGIPLMMCGLVIGQSEPLTLSTCHRSMLATHHAVIDERLQLESALAQALKAQAIFDTHIIVTPLTQDEMHRTLGQRYQLSEFDARLAHFFRWGIQLEPYIVLRELKTGPDNYQLREQGIAIEIPVLKMPAAKLKSDSARYSVRAAYFSYLWKLEQLMHRTTDLFMQYQYEKERWNNQRKEIAFIKQLIDRAYRLVSKGTQPKSEYAQAKRYLLDFRSTVNHQQRNLFNSKAALIHYIGWPLNEDEEVMIQDKKWNQLLEENTEPNVASNIDERSDFRALALTRLAMVELKEANRLLDQPDISLKALLGYQFQSHNQGDWEGHVNANVAIEMDVNTDRKTEKANKIVTDYYLNWVEKKMSRLQIEYQNHLILNKKKLTLTNDHLKQLKQQHQSAEARLKKRLVEFSRGQVNMYSVIEAHKERLELDHRIMSAQYIIIQSILFLETQSGRYANRIPKSVKETPNAELLNRHTIGF